MTSPKKHRMSFTTGSLLHLESVQLAELYLQLGCWKEVSARALEDNLLQSRTQQTLKRICREIIARLKHLTADELDFLIKSDRQDQGYTLWLAVCRHYSFIGDFAVEVLHERFISLKGDLQYDDYEAFFNRKAQWHDELEALSKLTHNKLRQVLFRMLREAGLLAVNSTIIPAFPSSTLIKLILRENPAQLQFFPIFESHLMR